MQPVPVFCSTPSYAPPSAPRWSPAPTAVPPTTLRNPDRPALAGPRGRRRCAGLDEVETTMPEALIVDSWLPDLDLTEFLSDFRDRFPQVDVVSAGGSTAHESQRGPYRQELLYALRRSQDTDTAVWNLAPTLPSQASAPASLRPGSWAAGLASGPASSSRVPVEAGGAPAKACPWDRGPCPYATHPHPVC